jgi:peptidoglycan/LPS O-acetylase OafA/YrhL
VFVGSSLFIFTRLLEPTLLGAGPHQYYYLYLGTLCGASVIGWAQWLASTARLPAIAVMGEHSMQIYVTHMLLTVGFRVVAHDLLGISNPFVIVAGGIATALVGAILLYKLIERFGLPNPFDPPLAKILPVRKAA